MTVFGPKRRGTARILSWNVNGIRAIRKKGLMPFIERARPDVLCLQETRAHKHQLDLALTDPPGFSAHFAEAEKKGYSGVCTYSRRAPHEVHQGLGRPKYDREGRTLITRVGALTVVNVYVPHGAGTRRDNSRVPYKLGFSRNLYQRLNRAKRAGERIVVLGDLNTAHRAIDLARPRQNLKTSGFLDEEREELDRWIRNGWVDTFRRFEDGPGHYSWWSQRIGVRAKNIGWRIDYILASPAAAPYLRDGFIWPEVAGSDHCPVGIDVDKAIFEP